MHDAGDASFEFSPHGQDVPPLPLGDNGFLKILGVVMIASDALDTSLQAVLQDTDFGAQTGQPGTGAVHHFPPLVDRSADLGGDMLQVLDAFAPVGQGGEQTGIADQDLTEAASAQNGRPDFKKVRGSKGRSPLGLLQKWPQVMDAAQVQFTLYHSQTCALPRFPAATDAPRPNRL